MVTDAEAVRNFKAASRRIGAEVAKAGKSSNDMGSGDVVPLAVQRHDHKDEKNYSTISRS